MDARHAKEAVGLVERHDLLQRYLAAEFIPHLSHGQLVSVRREDGAPVRQSVTLGQTAALAAFTAWKEDVRHQLAAVRRRAAQIELRLPE